jgi:hypothetical protein
MTEVKVMKAGESFGEIALLQSVKKFFDLIKINIFI